MSTCANANVSPAFNVARMRGMEPLSSPSVPALSRLQRSPHARDGTCRAAAAAGGDDAFNVARMRGMELVEPDDMAAGALPST